MKPKTIIVSTLSCVLIGAHTEAQVITPVAGADWAFPARALSALNAPLHPGGVAVAVNGDVYVADSGNHMVMQIAPNGRLMVFAGNGVAAFSGDGGDARLASLNNPSTLALDDFGNLYIADAGNRRVRVVSNGIITTVAGDGSEGSVGEALTGDGGPAKLARLSPASVAIDSAGNLFIADLLHSCIRKVSKGTITTVAGNGTAGYSGDGGPAVAAQFQFPRGIAVDRTGHLFIADSMNSVVRQVFNGVVTTVAGSGAFGNRGDNELATNAALKLPLDVAVNALGDLFIADYFNSNVRKVSQGVIATVAGNGKYAFSGDGGPAVNASLGGIVGIAADQSGRLYIAEADSGRVRRVSGSTITTIAGNGLFRFSGDGGEPTEAVFNNISAVAIDAGNNVYVADSNRIRKVANGVITTVAGTGAFGYSGDGESATQAQLFGPTGLAVDATGTLYIADTQNHVVRRVVGGVITTLAGNGVNGCVGDGGPSTSASLSGPTDLAIDKNGDLYIADPPCARIRKVAGGKISTVAGNGVSGYSGDGGPSTAAQLFDPFSIALNSFGDLFIADEGNKVVRIISNGRISTIAGNGGSGLPSGDGGLARNATLDIPQRVAVNTAGDLYITDNLSVRRVANGIITRVAGNGRQGSSGDGGLATSGALGQPQGITLDSRSNLYIADVIAHRVREVLSSPPSVAMNPTTGEVSLVSTSKGHTEEVNATVSANASSGLAGTVPGMSYTAQVTSGNGWLSVSPKSGSTPGLFTIKGDPFTLAPGVYNGTITVSVPLASPSTRTVTVQFTVGPAAVAQLAVDRDHLSFTYALSSASRSQIFTVSNQGGGVLAFTASVHLDSGQSANWLSVTPTSATATPNSPASLSIQADPSKLPPGTYTGQVTIQSTDSVAGAVTIPVTMTVTTNPHILLLSQTGLTFTTVQTNFAQNSGMIPTQSFGVLNLGSGVLNWTVETSTLKGGAWLLASPNAGSTDASASASAPLVTVSVNPANLSPGIYYGLVKVRSTGAANTPQVVVVVLQVLKTGTDLAPIVQPSALVFSSAAGNSSPSSQDVLVYDPTGTTKSFRSGRTTADGGNWFVTLPGDATIAPDQPTRIVVQPLVDNLAPGTYHGTLTLQFSDGRVNTVTLTFVVTAQSGVSSNSAHSGLSEVRMSARDSAGGCMPKALLPALVSLGPGFNVPAGYPQGLQAQVIDDCGNAHVSDSRTDSNSVIVTFSNGDAQVKLKSVGNGRWQGTWPTTKQSGASVTLTVTADNPGQKIEGTAQVNGGLGTLQPAPVVASNGVVSAASFAPQPLAPGGMVSIFGQQLSDGRSAAPTVPLPTQLNNTLVTIGDQVLPLLYTSDGQLNAVVPYGVNANVNQQLLVQRDDTYAQPVYVDVATTQPAVFAGAILDATNHLIAPSNPAHTGDVLVLYCAGLGPVAPAVADGAPAPRGPLSNTVNPVEVTIGGQNAAVLYSGLAPGFVGLYQVNVRVPAGISAGDQVPVVVSAAGQAARTVSTSVR